MDPSGQRYHHFPVSGSATRFRDAAVSMRGHRVPGVLAPLHSMLTPPEQGRREPDRCRQRLHRRQVQGGPAVQPAIGRSGTLNTDGSEYPTFTADSGRPSATDRILPIVTSRQGQLHAGASAWVRVGVDLKERTTSGWDPNFSVSEWVV